MLPFCIFTFKFYYVKAYYSRSIKFQYTHFHMHVHTHTHTHTHMHACSHTHIHTNEHTHTHTHTVWKNVRLFVLVWPSWSMALSNALGASSISKTSKKRNLYSILVLQNNELPCFIQELASAYIGRVHCFPIYRVNIPCYVTQSGVSLGI